jgi:hypothetical protein
MSLPQRATIAEPDKLRQLVQLARLGDHAAFEQLYVCRYRDICAFLIHLVHDAQNPSVVYEEEKAEGKKEMAKGPKPAE